MQYYFWFSLLSVGSVEKGHFRSFHLTFTVSLTRPTGQESNVGVVPTTKYIYSNHKFRDWRNNHQVGPQIQ